MLPVFKLYCKAVVIKAVQYWLKDRDTGEWKRIERSEMNPHLQGQSIYNKRDKSIQWGKENLLSKWFWENQTATCKRIIPDHSLIPHTQINSKWIKDLTVRPETIKLPEEIIGSQPFGISLSNISLDMSHQAREIKAKINKWDYIFCAQKETTDKLKCYLLNGRRYFQMIYPTRG